MNLLRVPIEGKFYNTWGIECNILCSERFGGLHLIFCLVEVLFRTGILGGLGGIQRTLGRMLGYDMPRKYTINFHSLEVDINNDISDMSGFWREMIRSHCCHWTSWKHKRLTFSYFHWATGCPLNPRMVIHKPGNKVLIGTNYTHPPKKCRILHINNFSPKRDQELPIHQKVYLP